VDAVIIYLG